MKNYTYYYNGEVIDRDLYYTYQAIEKAKNVKNVSPKDPWIPYSVIQSVEMIFDKYKIPSSIENVIFNNPATIVYWKDKTKTIVKCQDGDEYNKEIGLAMCIIKKVCGNKGNYNDVFEKWCK